ncbi:hypothetical protein FOA52_005588 [Chlamydomonas sp. UWO 241]|nr:hypothetical protein FOA52_005588 [Chlamydomonas sp. UWO 241]
MSSGEGGIPLEEAPGRGGAPVGAGAEASTSAVRPALAPVVKHKGGKPVDPNNAWLYKNFYDSVGVAVRGVQPRVCKFCAWATSAKPGDLWAHACIKCENTSKTVVFTVLRARAVAKRLAMSCDPSPSGAKAKASRKRSHCEPPLGRLLGMVAYQHPKPQPGAPLNLDLDALVDGVAPLPADAQYRLLSASHGGGVCMAGVHAAGAAATAAAAAQTQAAAAAQRQAAAQATAQPTRAPLTAAQLQQMALRLLQMQQPQQRQQRQQQLQQVQQQAWAAAQAAAAAATAAAAAATAAAAAGAAASAAADAAASASVAASAASAAASASAEAGEGGYLDEMMQLTRTE